MKFQLYVFVWLYLPDIFVFQLRLLYECNPMAFLIEQAGGLATTGRQRLMDIVPKDIHERAPVYMGSRDDVQDVIDIYKKNDDKK